MTQLKNWVCYASAFCCAAAVEIGISDVPLWYQPKENAHANTSLWHKIRTLWFPRSRNCGIGRLKLKCCFHVEEEHMSAETFTGGSKSGWHNKSPPSPSPTAPWAPRKHGEAAAHGSVFICEKAEKLDINPSVQNRAVPEWLVCVRWTVVLQISRPEKS